jgi:hypothetical protein
MATSCGGACGRRGGQWREALASLSDTQPQINANLPCAARGDWPPGTPRRVGWLIENCGTDRCVGIGWRGRPRSKVGEDWVSHAQVGCAVTLPRCAAVPRSPATPRRTPQPGRRAPRFDRAGCVHLHPGVRDEGPDQRAGTTGRGRPHGAERDAAIQGVRLIVTSSGRTGTAVDLRGRDRGVRVGIRGQLGR